MQMTGCMRSQLYTMYAVGLFGKYLSSRSDTVMQWSSSISCQLSLAASCCTHGRRCHSPTGFSCVSRTDGCSWLNTCMRAHILRVRSSSRTAADVRGCRPSRWKFLPWCASLYVVQGGETCKCRTCSGGHPNCRRSSVRRVYRFINFRKTLNFGFLPFRSVSVFSIFSGSDPESIMPSGF